MNELEQIVQRMIDAGESEENIAAVIKEYKNKTLQPSENAGKPTSQGPGAPVAETAAPEIQLTDTVSPSVNISSELPTTKSYSIDGKKVTKEEFDKYTEEQEKKKEVAKMGFINKLKVDLAKGSVSLGEMFASVPETIYDIAALPQNLLAKIPGLEKLKTSSKDFKETIDIENPILEYYSQEKEELEKVQNIYNNANYDTQGIYENFKKGNYSDGFKQLASGITESAPVSLSMMVGGATTSIGKLSAAGTVVFAGPEIATQREERPEQSEFANVIKGLGLAAAETVYSSIGTGTIGKVYKDILLREGKEEGVKIFRKGLVDMYSEALKKFGAPAAMLGEGVEEVATTVTQNMINGKNPFENVADSFIQGVGGGGVYGAPINTAQAISGVKDGITNIKINKELKNSSFNNIVDAFKPGAKSEEATINVSKIKNATSVFDKKVNLEVENGNITESEAYDTKLNFRKTQQAVNRLKPLEFTSALETEAVDLLKEKENLSNEIKEINDPSLTVVQKEKLETINNRLEELVVEDSKAKTRVKGEEDIAKAKKIAEALPEELNLTIEDFETTAEMQKALQEEGRTEGEAKKLSDSFGFIVQKPNGGPQKIYINKEVAFNSGVATTAQHEVLHAVLRKAIPGNIELGKNLKDFVEEIAGDKFMNTEFAQRFEAYELEYDNTLSNLNTELDTGAISQEKYDVESQKALSNLWEETMPLLSESITNGDIDVKSSIWEKLKDFLNRVFNTSNIKNVKFDSGKDVFNFVKDYNKIYKTGKGIKTLSKIAKGDIEGKLVTNQESKVDEVIKSSMGDLASSRVQQIYDEQGAAGAMQIVNEYRGMADKIASIYRERPGFTTYKEDLIDGILMDPTYGVMGLTLNYKPEENKGVPLAAYINKYLRPRSITLANQLLGKDEASTFKSDITEVKDVMATETAEDAITASEEIAKEKPKVKKQKLSEKIIFTKELGDIVKNQMIKAIALNIKKFDLETTKNRTITPFIADYKKDISDFLEKDIVKFIKEFGVEKFLIENRGIILDNFTTTFLSKHPFFRKGILKRVNGEWVAPTKIGPYKYDWIDEKGNKLKIDRDNAAGRGMTSGPEFIKRNPKIKEILKENEFVDYHFQDGALRNKIKVNPINSIARQIAAEQSFEILKDDLINNGELTQTIKERAGLSQIILGEDAIDNLAKDIDRGIVKFSLSSNSLKNIVKNSADIIEEFQGKSNSDAKTMADILKKYTVNEAVEDITSAAEYIVEALNKIFKPLITSNTPKNKAIEIIQSDLFNNLTISGGVVTLVGDKYNKLLIKGELTEQGEKLNKFYIDSWKNKLLKIKDPKDQAEELYKLIAFTSRTLRNDKFLKNNKQINNLLLSEIFKDPKLKHLKKKIKLTKTNEFRKPGIIGPKGRIGIPTEYNISEKSRQYKINEKYVQGYNYFSDEASRMLLRDYREIRSTGDINLFKNWASIQNQSRSLLRLAARLTHVEDNLNTKSKETVWEHMTPASEIMRLFAGNFISENLVSEQELINELKNYSVALVNESTDNALTEKGFKEITKRKNLLEKPITRYKKALSNENFNKIKEITVKEQEDRLLYSKSMNTTFNKMLERKKGILATETISKATSKLQGQGKGKFKVFVPPSADDLLGLLYNFLGTGKQGDADVKFFEEKLLRPLARANFQLNNERQSIKQRWQEVVKSNKGITKVLRKESDYKFYTNDHAVRVWLWDKLGYEIPGISGTDKAALIESVNSSEKLLKFGEELIDVPNKTESWLQPEADWTASTVEMDLQEILSKIGRARIFEEFITNADIIFSEDNLNKIEAAYGPKLRGALEDMLYRIEKGRARNEGGNKMAAAYLDWVRGSVATTMFFNTRSALLQQLSIVNFTNWEDNNIFAQGKFIAGSPKTYAKYWVDIFNSDWMKERRQGLKTDINESELVAKLEGSKNKNKALLAYVLEKGFSLTKYGDNIAIATGGAPFLYNREQKYIKEGMTEAEAKKEAFLDFQELAESTQQSSRQDLLSNQQVSVIGRIFLAFQNTTMQMTRLQKKAALDIINKRGSFKANISRLVYYGAIQNTIFSFLQSALFAGVFGDDEDENLKLDDKTLRAANTVLDSALRGSGIGGAALATLKNAIIAWAKENDKGWKADNSKVIIELLNISPAVGIKARKINTAMNAYKYGKKVVDDVSFANPNHPYYGIAGSLTSAAFNIPLDRVVTKAQNLQALTNQEAEAWQRTALFLGYNTWDVGLKDPEIEAAKKSTKKGRSSGRTSGRSSGRSSNR